MTAPLMPPSAPRLGLGLAALGRPGYVNLGHGTDLPDKAAGTIRAHTWDMLDLAWTAGLRYFDAARSYGRAEEFLGGWLRARGHAPATLTGGSKWGYTLSLIPLLRLRRTYPFPYPAPPLPSNNKHVSHPNTSYTA